LKLLRGIVICGLAALSMLKFGDSQTTPAGLQISPSRVDFGENTVNSDGPAHTVTVSNPTKSNITMDQIITSGIDFSEKHDCGQSLAPSAQCTIQVFFTPVISGPRTGNLDIMGSDLASPHFVALTGTGK
jgi:Transmembrane protein 131-like N-terminal